VLAKDGSDLLPGHIWVHKQSFLRENMKYLCPKTLQGMLNEQQVLIENVMSKSSGDALTMDQTKTLRAEKAAAREELVKALDQQTPLKWVDRVIMWCAEKMPSFTAGCEGADANAVVALALAKNSDVDAAAKRRTALIGKYAK